MITMAQLLRQHQSALIDKYQHKMTGVHYHAMQSILDCHTPASGEMQYQCHGCHHEQRYYHSCGNRSCPSCQHQTNNDWLEKQRSKLLPVDYYMVTFTLPRELRGFCWHFQRWAYQTLFECAIETLNTFANNDRLLKANIGATAVLHTHARDLAYHPHLHIVVPNGVINKKHRLWRKKKGKYLFNGRQLATVFRAKFLKAMVDAGYQVPNKTPKRWVAHCDRVGKGEPALVYLSRYLYRGVLNEKNIISTHQGKVTYRYEDSETKQWKTRKMNVEDFLWRVLQHVLPKGFRRARDYGFLHGNAKKALRIIQLILHVSPSPSMTRKKKNRSCKCCGGKMHLVCFIKPKHRWRELAT